MTSFTNLGLAFDDIAHRRAEHCALYYPASGERVSYAQLNRLVERLTAVFHAKGLRQGQVVALFHDKSPAAFAAMLACLRLGLIYTNLDPGSPWERIRKILQTCQPALIASGFADRPFHAELTADGLPETLVLQQALDLATANPADMPLPPIIAPDGGAPAYIMFTSGSTGMPKGAVMSHANLLWFAAWTRERFAIVPDDVISNVNPMYFDNSVFDFYSSILCGATLLPINAEQVRDTRLLVRLINQAACTLWFSVPSLLVYLLTTRALSPTDWPSLRKIVFGGEGFPKTRLRQLYELFGQRAELENVYGPTECTCICSAHTITVQDFDDMQSLAPLGLLAQNFDFEILAADSARPERGQLFLRGPQVGLGYYNDPQRRAAAFIQNPRHNLYADIGYLTGDIVQRDSRGWLHFKGRVDFQIKHMGYRIELEEIEAALGSVSGVMECAVVYQKMGNATGEILAFAVVHAALSAEQLQEALTSLLPAYMQPRHMTILEKLPKNANGKIDRIALQIPAI
ncbi:AMP-binding protein [Janthinobacterium sp. UMAB-60]|uniref:AMP-binding protein n=1 Tax=Janthinobacterium sp. UMAB-60 TaxID=1365365 RepID=UPI001C57892A|nr:AMP-binding protein [Janthinobacterium sp. UMAB-60]